MPDSRKADFYLGCLDGSVFLDFNCASDKCIYLCRISFDRFGCCDLVENAKGLSVQSSEDFLIEIAKEILDQEKITKIVLELVQLNKDNIWTDALEAYHFIVKQ